MYTLSLLVLISALGLVVESHHHGPTYETVNVNVSEPRNNSPLNTKLAHYDLRGPNGRKHHLTHSYVNVSCGATMSVYHTDPAVFPDGGTKQRPLLLLNHGYPETAYAWRHVTPEICKRVPCVVADRSGYGLSTSCADGASDERTQATAILDTVTSIYGKNKSVVLAGHDRGARAMHRAAVDFGQGAYPGIDAIGLWLADIVPIVEEYASFKNPKNAVGYFHWSFLPRSLDNFSTNVIMAYGGGNFIEFLLKTGIGINATAEASFRSGNAFETYRTFFDQLSVTNASVQDYTTAASIDYQEEVADQEAGRKVKMPTHVEYSYYNMVELSGFDIPGIWANWVDPSAQLTTETIRGGQGHFIVELAPSETVSQLHSFLDRLDVKR